MSAPLFFLCCDIANIVCNALLAARVLARRPRLLIALINFDTICYIVLSRQEYGCWIPEAYRFNVGALSTFLNFAQNLTPGLFMILCFTLFADRPRFPRWLFALFFVEIFLEVPMRWLIGAGALGDFAMRVAPAILACPIPCRPDSIWRPSSSTPKRGSQQPTGAIGLAPAERRRRWPASCGSFAVMPASSNSPSHVGASFYGHIGRTPC
jgi:hypothetical protein